MFMKDDENCIAARTVAHPLWKIFAFSHWALTLAPRLRIGQRRQTLPTPLAITPMLFAADDTPAIAGPVTPTRLHAPPASRCVLTRRATITRLQMGRSKQTLTTLEQTMTRPIRTTPWPPAGVWSKMTLVHGRLCSHSASLGAKVLLRSEARFWESWLGVL